MKTSEKILVIIIGCVAVLSITAIVLIGVKTQTQVTLSSTDTIVSKQELKMYRDAAVKCCPKDTTIVNPVLYEMSKILGEPKTFKVKRK